MKTFRKQLKEQMKDPEFAKAYIEEKERIDLAVKIASERNKLGISQAELAKKAKVTQQQLSRVENGANCNMHTFIKVCTALGLKLNFERGKSRAKI
ncbi:MAG: helix-turn-helix transcriptional regulator [Spirochaetes bacterium]|nr:helix-turn-helix transcriptional regulator [Spirochaetota bacterium]